MKKMRIVAAFALLAALLSSVQAQPAAEPKEKIDPQEQLAGLLKELSSAEGNERVQAIVALADFGPKAKDAVPDLIKALKENDEDVRLNAAITLGKIGKAAVGELTELLPSENEDVRFYSVWALGWIGADAKAAAPAVIRALADKSEGVRRKAAFALGRIAPDPETAVPALINALDDKQEDVCQAAADGLSKIGAPAVKALIEALTGPEKVRQHAANALGEIGPDAKAAIPALKELLLADKNTIPVMTSQAMAKIGKEAIPALVAVLKDERPAVRMAGLEGLSKIGAPAVGHLVDALGDKRVDMRRYAAQLLGPMRIGDKMVVLALAFAIKDKDEQVRQMSLSALQQLGPAGKLAAPYL